MPSDYTPQLMKVFELIAGGVGEESELERTLDRQHLGWEYVDELQDNGYIDAEKFDQHSSQHGDFTVDIYKITNKGTRWYDSQKASHIPDGPREFAEVIEDFLSKAEAAVMEWEGRMGGEPAIADTYGAVADAAKTLRQLSGQLERVRRALQG